MGFTFDFIVFTSFPWVWVAFDASDYKGCKSVNNACISSSSRSFSEIWPNLLGKVVCKHCDYSLSKSYI